MAEITAEKAERDRNYQQRLKEFAITKQQHETSMRESGNRKVAGILAEITNEKGGLDFSDPDMTRDTALRLNDAYQNNEYMQQTLDELVRARSKGKYSAGRFVPIKGGMVVEMFNRDDPSKRGVVTDNASTDPNDPVTKFSPTELMDVASTIDFLKVRGVPPSQAAYLLAKQTSFAPESNFSPENVNAALEAEFAALLGTSKDPMQQDREDLTGNKPIAYRDEYADAPAASTTPRSRPPLNAFNYTELYRQASEDADAKAKKAEEDNLDTRVIDVTPINKYSENGKVKEKSIVASAIEDPISVFRNAAVLKQFARETEVERRGLKRLEQGVQMNNERLGRYLLGAVARGAIPEGQAASLIESGRGDALSIGQMYFKQPSLANLQLELMKKGGLKTKEEDLVQMEKDIANDIDNISQLALKNLPDKAPKMDIGSMGTGVRAGLLYAGFITPQDRQMALQEHRQAFAAALSRANAAITSGTFKGINDDDVISFYMMSEMRNVRTPEILQKPEDQIQYAKNAMALLNKYASNPLVAANMVEVYRAKVANSGGKLEFTEEEISEHLMKMYDKLGMIQQ